VDQVDVFVRISNALLMLLLPLFLGVYLQRRFRVGWRLFFIGGLAFVGSQVLHIPFNRAVLGPFLENLGLNGSTSSRDLWLISLMLGLSAGLFEESVRYLCYRYILRDARSWEAGVTFGAGWGGVESMLLGALALIGLYQALAFRSADLNALVPPEQVAQASAELANYWSIPWYGAILGALERIFAITIQISLSVIVLQAFVRGSLFWLLLAVGWHTFVNAVGLFALGTWGPYAAEGIIGLTAIVSLGVIFALRQRGQEATPGEEARELSPVRRPTAPGGKAAIPTPNEQEIDPELLDDSRFH
jgi:uncharacterized membrane protein YhfC